MSTECNACGACTESVGESLEHTADCPYVRIRAEALEEAAKEAVRHTTHPDDPTNEVWQSAYNHVATEIAAAIRALVLPSTGEKT